MSTAFTRRDILSAGAAWAASTRLGWAQATPPPPSRQITLGCIGVGTHGNGVNLASFLEEPDARALAVCDVMKDRRENAKARVDTKYGNGDCKAIADFREILSDPAIDAVVISTPDHWHVPMSLMGLAAGKHVFCEKPTLTIAQGRELVQAVKASGRIYQGGIEDRSLAPYHKLAFIVRNGGIGKLSRMEVVLPAGTEYPLEAEQPVPEGLDYNLWLGPAPLAPYSPTRLTPQGWRNIRDYSGGKFTDWGSHLIDTAQVANFSEKSTPVEVRGQGDVPSNALTNVPVSYELEYRYANGVDLKIQSGDRGGDNGANAIIKCTGSDGWISITGWRGRMEAHDRNVFRMEVPAQEDRLWPLPPREHRSFLDGILRNETVTYPATDIHALSTTMHIGNIAMELGRPLKWSPEKEEFEGDAEANALRSRTGRDWARG